MALSDTTVRLARAKGTDYTLNDLDGLALFVRAKGSKYWYFRFSWDGKQTAHFARQVPGNRFERRPHPAGRSSVLVGQRHRSARSSAA
jgi:hypothetical protein